MYWPMRARGPCSTHNNMHRNAASTDCNTALATASKNERSCARRALQGLPSNTKICGQGVVVTLGKATVCSPGLCCSRVAGGCARVVTSASSPRRTALLVWSGGAPRCSTSGLSPSTSSPRRISARASLLTLESRRVLVSEHTSGRWRHFCRAVSAKDASAISRRARSEIATGQLARLAAGRGVRTRTSRGRNHM